MTDIKKPYIGLSEHRLTDLINAANPTQPPLMDGVDFLYGTPVETTYSGYNTRVRLKNQHPNGADRDIYYNRLSLAVLNELPDEFIGTVTTHDVEFYIHDILNEINSALGLTLIPSEVYNTKHSCGEESYPLVIKPQASLAWLGDTSYNFKLTPHLKVVITITDLDGLYPPLKVIR